LAFRNSLISPDGVELNVNWDADENKFQATGDHLPTPPPMHKHKLKYEMNPIDGDRLVVEKKDDGTHGSYSFMARRLRHEKKKKNKKNK
jgi:hypothetical protein